MGGQGGAAIGREFALRLWLLLLLLVADDVVKVLTNWLLFFGRVLEAGREEGGRQAGGAAVSGKPTPCLFVCLFVHSFVRSLLAVLPVSGDL